MEQETLQKKYDKLLDLVRRVRGRQREYEKYRASSDLKTARLLERKLDEFLKEEVKAIESKQGGLF